MRARNNSEAVDVAGRPEPIRYPGVAKLFLIWGVVGALTGARYQLPFGASEPVRDMLLSLLACTTWFLPWAVLTPIVFRIERKLPLGSSGWPRNMALLAAISVPFCLSAAPVMVALFTAAHGFGAPGWESGSRRWLGPFLSAESMFWCSVAVGYFFRTLFQLHEQERRASRLALEKSLLEASLVNASNPCRCARKTRGFIERGYIDPQHLLFARERTVAVRQVAGQRSEYLDELYGAYTNIHRTHPFYQGPDFVAALRSLIECGDSQLKFDVSRT